MKRYFVDFAMGFTWAILDASDVYGPLKALANINFVHMGLSIDPCVLSITTYSWD